MKKLYSCGIDWQCEIGEAPDLEGKMPLYSTIEELKENRTCWKECGIVELSIKLNRWVEPQNLIGTPVSELIKDIDKKSDKE
jgi:hypothetical protein